MIENADSIEFALRCAAGIIRESRKGVVLSGAGISTPSGIPDFRSTNSGLWEHANPMEVASLLSFRYHPDVFYEWMRPLAQKINLAEPNPAHLGLTKLQNAGYIQTIVTQNIDGLHQKAGSEHVLEMHGSMQTLTCIGCFRQYPAGNFVKPYLQNGTVPHCPDCDNILKPDLVLFGEQLPVRIWLNAQAASKSCDLMIVAGSSLEVLPAAGLPMRALENGAHLIIINKSHTYLDVRADVVFHEDLAEIIPLIVQYVFTNDSHL
ncbi:MAG: NAD-dependent deacetylase [Chloroflexi bacterium]|jgi:NAD-dependent deacetylase|nr:NAD-dependent deacetylase [Chloroflexota bacterium]